MLILKGGIIAYLAKIAKIANFANLANQPVIL